MLSVILEYVLTTHTVLCVWLLIVYALVCATERQAFHVFAMKEQ